MLPSGEKVDVPQERPDEGRKLPQASNSTTRLIGKMLSIQPAPAQVGSTVPIAIIRTAVRLGRKK